jgi:hypothetical protein
MSVIITKPYSSIGGVYSFVENILPFFTQKVYVFHRGKNPQIRNKVYLLLLILLNPIFFYIKIKKNKSHLLILLIPPNLYRDY